jgi:hypothetical protein
VAPCKIAGRLVQWHFPGRVCPVRRAGEQGSFRPQPVVKRVITGEG